MKSNAPLDDEKSDAEVEEQLKSKSADAKEFEMDDTESGSSVLFDDPKMSFSNSTSCCIKFRLGEMTPLFARTRSNAVSRLSPFLNMR